MKTFNLTFILLAFLLNINAQETASINLSSYVDSSTSLKDEETSKVLRKKHNSIAKNQLYTFLSDNLAYSSIDRDNLLEGEVTLEVSISKEGLITECKIIKSDNKAFNKIVLDNMLDFKSLNIKEKKYFGSNKIKVPINFSL